MTTKAQERVEEKVRRLVEVLEHAREENARLRRELDGRDETVPGTKPPGPAPAPTPADVDRQLHLLQEERSAIRDRVERAIGMLEEAP